MKAPHSIFGAAIARRHGRATDVAFAVVGHHAGMPDSSEGGTKTTNETEKASHPWGLALADFPQIAECFKAANPHLRPFSADSLVVDVHCRILLSRFFTCRRNLPKCPAYVCTEL